MLMWNIFPGSLSSLRTWFTLSGPLEGLGRQGTPPHPHHSGPLFVFGVGTRIRCAGPAFIQGYVQQSVFIASKIAFFAHRESTATQGVYLQSPFSWAGEARGWAGYARLCLSLFM